MTAPARRPTHRLLLGLTVGGLLALPGAASAAPTTVPLAGPGDDPVRFSGGLDQFSGGIPVPVRWTAVDGRVRLSWRASDQLRSGSGLQVSVGDAVVGSTTVGPGRGSATFRIPRTALRGADRTVPVTVATRLRTDEVCPAPDDPTAWLQLDRASAVTVDGTAPSTAPRLKDLPRAMVTSIGRERGGVLVRFTAPPTPDGIRAASSPSARSPPRRAATASACGWP